MYGVSALRADCPGSGAGEPLRLPGSPSVRGQCEMAGRVESPLIMAIRATAPALVTLHRDTIWLAVSAARPPVARAC
jgi:hypothetical protein